MFPRLYAILDVELTRARGLVPLDILRIWLDAGIRLVQLRAKSLAGGELLELADEFVARATAAGAISIVNDRADIARMARARGVHVGQSDLAPADVRQLLGETAIVGLSTHTLAQVDAAMSEPISYLAVGPVFPTLTKGTAVDAVVGLSLVRDAAERASPQGLPVVAIGGITLDRTRAVLAAGATSVAVISDLLAGDPAARCRQYLEALE